MNGMPNVFLLVIDALRADGLGCLGSPRETSPNLDVLAKDSVVFERHYSQGAGTPTSFPALLSGRYTSSCSARLWCSADRRLISEMLQAAGYTTACIQTSPFLMTEFGYNKGYDFFDQSLLPVLRHTPPHSTCRGGELALALTRSARKEVAILGLKVIYQALYRQSSCLPAPLVSHKILTWLTKHRDCQKPFFVFAHYEDVHEPYTPPAQHVRLFAQKGVNGKRLMKKGRRSPELLTPDQVHQLRAVYDAGIHYLDAQLGRLFTRLKKLDIYDESLIVLTADHGDGFMEHGFVSHPQRLYNELLHVPLIIKFPHRVHSSHRETKLSRALDIVPTILDFCGVPLLDDLDGNSLLPRLSGSGNQNPSFSISEGYSDASLDETLTSLAIQDDTWKLIISGVNAGEQTYELYNLRVDPQEQQNVHDRFLEVAPKLKERLQEHHSRLSGVARLDDSERLLLDDIVTERLRALGYLGD